MRCGKANGSLERERALTRAMRVRLVYLFFTRFNLGLAHRIARLSSSLGEVLLLHLCVALHLSDRFEYQAYVVAYCRDVLTDLGEQVSGLLVFFVCAQPFQASTPRVDGFS